MNPHRSSEVHKDFTDSIDPSRPRTLLTDNVSASHILKYRYEDTGETTTVPNVWVNQPVAEQIKTLRFLAECADNSAMAARNVPFSADPVINEKLIAGHIARAHEFRRQATALEQAQ